MQPAAYELLDSLPLTANGKVDRRRLRAAEVAAGPAQPKVPPRNDTERTLAAIAQEVLQAGEVGIHQNFFDLGGTSLHMVQILNRARSAFGRDLPVTEIFRHPTIGSLAAFLSGEGDDGPGLARSDERASRRRSALAGRRAVRRGARP
jgi:acyl carrier protein